MKKIAAIEQDKIVHLLRKWPIGLTLTWEALRNKMAAMANVGLDEVWSRQSLSANQEVYAAFSAAKRRPQEGFVNEKPLDALSQQRRVSELESALSELKTRYDILLLRHTQLAYNASLLEGGSHLLDDSLPDNTKSQRGR